MKKNEDDKRLVFLDASKGIGILAVMYGHITVLGNPVDRWCATFKLPIFFIITGFLLCRSNEVMKTSFRDFAVKKAKSLLIPYFYFSLLTILYRVLIDASKGKDLAQQIDRLKDDVYRTLSFRGITALWFLTALFFAEILFYYVMRQRLFGKIACTLIAVILYFQTSGAISLIEAAYSSRIYKLISMPTIALTKGFVGFLFISAGYMLYMFMQKFPDKKQHLLFGLFLFAVNLVISRFNRGTLDFNNMKFGTFPILFFVCALAGSIGWILIFHYLTDRYRFPILSWCGLNSLILMATHTTFGFKNIMVKGWAAIASLSSEVGLRYYLECLIILMLLLIFEYGVVDFVNKKVPFLIGRSKRD